MDEWQASAEVRYVTPSETTTKPPRLQQLWVKDRINGWGHVVGYDVEWRDVPLVVIDR